MPLTTVRVGGWDCSPLARGQMGSSCITWVSQVLIRCRMYCRSIKASIACFRSKPFVIAGYIWTGIRIRANSQYVEQDGVTPFLNPDSLPFVRNNPPSTCNHFHLEPTASDGTATLDDGWCDYPPFQADFVCQGRCWPDGKSSIFAPIHSCYNRNTHT